MAAHFTSLMHGTKNRPALLAFLLASAFIATLCIAFNPRWATNDDVAMSMIAHGYGLAAYGSPHLIFSNVLWGYLVRSLPTINGVFGYSLATLAVLLVFGWATLYFLFRLGAGYLTSLLAVALLVEQPTLLPQFTVNAGLLTVAAVIGWQVYARHGGVGSLVTACLLAFFGFLIRGQEFLLVLGVALPFLPWRALGEQRQMQLSFLLLVVAIVSASAFDRWSYSGPEWQHFEEFNSVRIPFSDYGAGKYLKQHPDIIARHGYSQNDIDLLTNWFFADPHISAPNSLNALLAELGPLPMQGGNIQTGWVAIKALSSPVLLSLLLSSLVLLVLMPRKPIALAWLLCMASLFAMGIMGRPGMLRVYVPLMSLLLVAPLMFGTVKRDARQWIATLALFLACVGNAYLLFPSAWESQQWTKQVQRDIRHLPVGPVISWANGFPFELAFPVLSGDTDSRNIMFYGLDSFTHAPFSVANTEQQAGRGMIERLQTATGIPIVLTPQNFELLRIYCQERLGGQLRSIIIYPTRAIPAQQVRCEAAQ